MTKKIVTLYGGDVIIEFDPGVHGYKQIGAKFNQWPVPGFTSIKDKVIPKHLIPWAVGQVHDHMILGWTDGMDKERFIALCAEAKKAPDRIRDSAGDTGTISHSFFESILKTGKGTLPTDPLAAKACAAFLGWFHMTEVVCLASERICFSKHHWYCCTCDFYGMIDKELCVADFKTSSGVFYDEGNILQLVANQVAITEELEVPINVCYILHLDKNTGKFTPHRFEITETMRNHWRRALDWYRSRNDFKSIIKQIKGDSNAKNNHKRAIR